MFTWNFQYVSKARLTETLNQLMINSEKGDVLIRIHTAIHLKEEAVDLAKYIKKIVPNAHIFGTSTTAVFFHGKLLPNQCVISVTLMDKAKVDTVMIPTFDKKTKDMISGSELCDRTADYINLEAVKLMLAFTTVKYREVSAFVDEVNEKYPKVQMIGGIAVSSDAFEKNKHHTGFVFDEKTWSDEAMLIATISGNEVESFTSCATGIETVGEEHEITDAFANCILEIDGKDAAEEYRNNIGDVLKKDPSLSRLFPFAYSDAENAPLFVWFHDNMSISESFPRENITYKKDYDEHLESDIYRKRKLIRGNHNFKVRRKIKRAFVYDQKIVHDNRMMFRRIENFEKAETIFAYSCLLRSQMYPDCVRWELSVYEETNMCGCITDGEIVTINGKSVFANCTFVVSVFGEKSATQNYNPYVFTHTESLASNNKDLIDYIINTESEYENKNDDEKNENTLEFLRECEAKLFVYQNEEIPNEVALNTDIGVKGYDRICMIDITDSTGMKTVFSKQLIDLTYKNYLSTCQSFVQSKNYKMYLIDGWHIAIGTPSYRTSLADFKSDMGMLQKSLFETSRENIAIVPLFCIIDGCTLENIDSAYYSARVEMMNKNIQFYVTSPMIEQLDEESMREKYHMVNVVNYAIAHDKIIPYFQGIYDNKSKSINHYESLMRLEDENGRIYYPVEFLDVARNFGHLYDSLSKTMIKKVFDIFKDVKDKSVSINLGIRDIKNPEITEYIYDFMASAKYPQNFVFEILENEDIDEYDILVAFVDRIHALGGLISIDDFGSGYSNLQHLMSIHSDYIKIDGSIIRHCCENDESERLVALIVGWKDISAREIAIVAEYVENSGIQEKMTRFGIDYSQGYLFSKPSPDINL